MESSKTKIAAIVPMRHTSERVPGKNYRNFAGVPLYHHIINTLLACPQITKVMIDTDSDLIMADSAEHFPTVMLYRRPENLRDGNIAMNDVLLNSVSQIKADVYLQTHSTNPLLKTSTITKAISTYLNHQTTVDSLFSVTRMQTRLWGPDTQPLNHDPAILVRTQDLEPVFEENSCLYLFSEKLLRDTGCRIGKKPMMFEIDRIEAQDIDEEQDFRIAESIFKALG